MSKQTRTLLLLRHAKSSWESDAEDDFDRPLVKRGRQDAAKVGWWLKQQQWIPDSILSSPAKRARKTILKVCGELDFDTNDIQWVPEIYDAGLKDLLRILKECRDQAKTVLMVGHNPGLEYLLEYLCRERVAPDADGKLLTTAGIVNLELTTKWSAVNRSDAKLNSITRPGQMK